MTYDEVNAMKRDDLISLMMDKAKALTKKWTRAGEDEIWEMCSNWNSEHYGGCYDEAEIFMCEYQSEDSEYVNGFMIEDDYWTFEK